MTSRLNKFERFYLKNKLIINCAILLALFFVHCFWGYTMYIVYPIILALVIFDNLRNGFSYLMFTIPFSTLCLNISAILFAACVLIYILKFYWILYIREKSKPNIALLVSIGAFLVYCALPTGKYNANLFAKLAILFLIFTCVIMIIKKPNVIRLGFNIKILSVSLLLSCLLFLTYFISPYLQSFITFDMASDKIRRFEAFLTQPNVFAMMCEILLAALAYFIISKQASWKEYSLFILLTIAGLTTFSKTFLIIVCVIYFAIFVSWLIKSPIKTLVITSIAVGIIVIIGVFNMKLVMVFYNRFMGGFKYCNSFADFMNMITTGRAHLWIVYLSYLGENPLALFFGRGLGAPLLDVYSAHNSFISMIYQLGLVGVALFVVAIVFMVLEFKKNNKYKLNKAICLPWIVLTLMLMVEDLVFYIFTF